MWSPRFFGLVLQLSVALFAETDANKTSPAYYVHVWTKFVDPNGIPSEVSPRIHGGAYAEERAFPFMVFTMATRTNDFRSNVLTCSTSLIHEQWLLTAAHCVMPKNNPPKIIAAAGKADLRDYIRARMNLPFDRDINEEYFGLQERRVRKVNVHPSYGDPENGHDLALLLLDKPFQMSDAVKTLPLSKKRMSVQESCTVLGWGLDDYDRQTFRLMYANQVHAQTPEIYCTYFKSEPLICLKKNGGGICRGDSGSPLVCGDHIWGVASFSVSLKPDPSCRDQEEEYFSQIYPDISWIDQVLGNAGSSPNVKSMAFFFVFVIWLIV